MSVAAVVTAAKALVAEVDRRHDQDKPPRRYMTPYGEVTKLRLALAAYDQESRRDRTAAE